QKAVIATRFSGIEEQIVNGESGLIVGNNEQSIVDGLASLLKDPDLVLRLAKSPLQPAVLDDSEKVESIERLIQGQEKNDRD
ncbi:MAG TPA: glycosyltransferase, partial [Dokdonella sp.]|uniref:glycosyltransferase n=1 Tax=Dokdonella sp. TaxID=2291710 RepID=UPI002D7E4D16